MSRILVWVSIRGIRLYQRWAPRRLRSACRFRPSCSEFALRVIERWGFVQGWELTLLHLAMCRPPHAGEWPAPMSDEQRAEFYLGPPVAALCVSECSD